MGNDAPLACLSLYQPLPYEYFKQLFAQVGETFLPLHFYLSFFSNGKYLYWMYENLFVVGMCVSITLTKTYRVNHGLTSLLWTDMQGHKRKKVILPLCLCRSPPHLSFVVCVRSCCSFLVGSLRKKAFRVTSVMQKLTHSLELSHKAGQGFYSLVLSHNQFIECIWRWRWFDKYEDIM